MKQICIYILIAAISFNTLFGFARPAQAIFGVGDTVVVVGNTSPLDIKNTVENTFTAVQSAITAVAAGSLQLKEYVLDNLAKQLLRATVRAMVRDIVDWINGGFNGSPAFVDNLNGFLLNVADETAGDFIYNNEDLKFLCEPFQLDIKISLAVQYNKNRGDTFVPQCTLSEVSDNIESFISGDFSEGGWASWFELTQGEYNDPNKALIAAESAMYARITNAEGQVVKELDWGKGLLSFKVCADGTSSGDTAAGSVSAKKDCNIVTPGQAIADQLNSSLNVGRDELIAADELNEVLGALLSQLAQKAISGIGGILGLSGGGSEGGSSSGSSYLDQIVNEVDPTTGAGTSNTTGSDRFSTYINDGEKYVALLQRKRAMYTNFISSYNNNKSNYENCSLTSIPDLPTSITGVPSKTQGEINHQNERVAALKELKTRYEEAKAERDIEAQQAILNNFNQLAQAGTATASEMNVLKVELDYRAQQEFDDYNSIISSARSSCRDNSDNN